ncbi:DUF1868 domain-containing protein [Martelella sp. HB161492]|uniref:DUF1868 domain-containing protein n=1 Tax=Martelella sp. HB161492 TaxID=2720726 RepID=UPI00158FD95D|nr:DUF1868 domain-containing protein [Martelella sp. HB161492]
MQPMRWTFDKVKRQSVINRLTPGPDAGPLPREIVQTEGNGKFTAEGKVLPFPGNTFICHIDRQSEFFDRLCRFQDAFKRLPLADRFSFLPRESFHMTIFCGVSGNPLGIDGWPDDLPRDAGLEAVNAAFVDKLGKASGEDGFSVRASGLELPATIAMEPDTRLDELKLRCIRAKLQELTGIVRGDIFDYAFHVSMAYPIRWLTRAEAELIMSEAEALFAEHLSELGPIALGPPEFCAFNTMYRFDTIGQLAAGGYRRFSGEPGRYGDS